MESIQLSIALLTAGVALFEIIFKRFFNPLFFSIFPWFVFTIPEIKKGIAIYDCFINGFIIEIINRDKFLDILFFIGGKLK